MARRTKKLPDLSPRQRQALMCLAEGKTNKEIGETLGISEGTVKIHLLNLFRKLGVRNRVEAAAMAGEMRAGEGRSRRGPIR
jgi:DNA-binding CsgD family transcriptional regulator